MNVIQWERAKEIFDAALDLPADVRSAYLQQACQHDIVLRTEVEELLAADEHAGSFLDPAWLASTLTPQPDVSLHPGDVVSGRFRIVRPLGDGGMGQVYEAHDSELGVQVALKTLRPEIARDPEVLFRFRQEVRIAHRITHPNVCRTFHLDRELRQIGPDEHNLVDLTFLTMEYLNGETLQQILKRSGCLSPSRALAIARQMAAAIDAAHHTGIIHRDIKPGNVMVCPSPSEFIPERVVITDFGLAKFGSATANNGHSSISHPGRAMGTLSYMSPEQLKATDAGPATDIYAFGIVLFEMVTGEKAFPDSASLEAASLRIITDPPSPKALVPNLSTEWDTSIRLCLQVDPSARCKDAASVIAILDGNKTAQLPLKVSDNLTSFSSKLIALTLAVILCVALSFLGFRFYSSRANSSVAPGTLVYLAPAKNETGEKQLDNVTELMRASLNQSAHINLLDASRVGDYLQQMTKPPDTLIDAPTAREIAMRAGAARVIFASVKRNSANYQLDIEVQQTDSTPLRYHNHWRNHFTWQQSELADNPNAIPTGLLSAIRNASDWIRSEVGESNHDIAQLGIPPENVTTSNWQALTSYATAQKLLAQGRKEDAVAQLQDAVKRDAGFARAHADLADNLISVGRRQEGYQEYLNALNSDTGERLSRKERDFIKGTFATDTRDYQAALSAFRDYSAFYENDFDAWFYQAYPLDMLDRPADAIHALQRANTLGSTPNMGAGQLAYSYMLLGDYATARTHISELSQTHHKDLANALGGTEAFLSGNYSAALQSFQQNQNSTVYDYRIVGYYLGARLLAEQGLYPEALKTVTNGLDALASVPDTANDKGMQWLDRASIESHLGNFSSCIDDIIESSHWNTTPDAMLMAGTIVGNALPHLSAADRSRAQALLTKMEASLPDDSLGLVYTLARLRLQGELALIRKDPKAALVAFRKADALGAPIASREYLARALLASVSLTQKPADSLALKNEALRIYARSALRPASIWRLPYDYPPGFVGDQMASYLSLAKSLGRNDSETQSIRSAFAKLRNLRAPPQHYPLLTPTTFPQQIDRPTTKENDQCLTLPTDQIAAKTSIP